MKRFARILCALFLCGLLTGCGHGYDEFDPESEGVVDVIVNARESWMSDRSEDEIRYYALASNKRIRLTEAFESDPMTVYTVPLNCFIEYKSPSKKNRILHQIRQMELLEADGNQVSVSEEKARVFRRIEELEHGFLRIRIIDAAGQTFVCIELNVNLWTPCDFYWYDPDADALVLLHTWDDEEVIGLHVRDMARAR